MVKDYTKKIPSKESITVKAKPEAVKKSPDISNKQVEDYMKLTGLEADQALAELKKISLLKKKEEQEK